jgi:predicted CoA-substrate-specific enzyme activase
MRNLQPTIATSAGKEANTPATGGVSRFIGIDVGAETVKLVELLRDSAGLRIGRRQILEHGKAPGPALLEALRGWDWDSAQGAAVSGRFAGQIKLPRIPAKQAQLRGYRFFFRQEPATVVNIGSHGFSVLEVRANGVSVFRENSRCSQGTGNFLRQLVERFSLTVPEASALCAEVTNPAPLSGRCPVILKTDMTHLANKGEDRARILAGLFDAVCENVLVLLKPGLSPGRVLLTGGVSRAPRVRRVFGEALKRYGMELVPFDEQDSLCLEALGCAFVAAGGEKSEIRNPKSETNRKLENSNVQNEHSKADFGFGEAARLPSLARLLLPPREIRLEQIPGLGEALEHVRRMPPPPWVVVNGEVRRLALGFDIGSTGAKLVAMDALTREALWEGYRQTLGDPVGAAQDLVRRFTGSKPFKCPVVALGATGSGREIVGSLMTSCFGKEAVYIVNEIVAHATGALHYEPRVDTIFEIGGQDAKYIRLAEGRIVDCAMNEACSAGTGSFIEEQGRKFSGIQDVRQLGEAAVRAKTGVSLGQHCSVFMAEVIDEGVAAGVEQSALISGLYDSIIKNYLNRVKGNRSVGKVIFCQGMPFSADALAAAVARQTGSQVVVPPNPGTVVALGIALLAARELMNATPLDLKEFLGAAVEQKDTFVCQSNSGCGGAGNRCRIERLRTALGQKRSCFTWGGGCALHDKATRKRKLPDLAPNPFRQRDDLLQKLLTPLMAPRGNSRVALCDEFMFKGMLPFFAGFLHEAGFDLELVAGDEQAALKRGIQAANVPFCAPMQLFLGMAERMAKTGAEVMLVPMLRSVPPVKGQRRSAVCPLVQACPDVLQGSLAKSCRVRGGKNSSSSSSLSSSSLVLEEEDEKAEDLRMHSSRPRVLSPRIDFGPEGWESKAFLASCRALGRELGLSGSRWRRAWEASAALQQQFDNACLELGRRALEFCRARDVVPVVVLGRSYTIFNPALNSNVPAILREQGAIGIPADCYPVGADTPQFTDMFWGYGHNLLRAAHQVRRTPGVYALYCSNYSCGPDSFNLHFAGYVMAGKPFAVIETDGHSGDAGTRTRVEAFLHCVEEDLRAEGGSVFANDFGTMQFSGLRLRDFLDCNGGACGTRDRSCSCDANRLRAGTSRAPAVAHHRSAKFSERFLIPYIGPSSEVVTACLRGVGLPAENLPAPDADALRRGRAYTSGKECLPMPLTLGSLLQRLEQVRNGERFIYVMPSTDGPCRFGAYNLLNQIVLERLGWRNRLRIWSPKDTGYFDDLPAGTEMLMLAGIIASDLLLQAKLDVRPAERDAGEAEAIHQRFFREILAQVEAVGRRGLALGPALWQVISGRLFGLREVLARAGSEFARAREPRELPVVELTGEIYVRAVEFSNDFIIGQLEARGLRVHLAPQFEWLSYCGYVRRHRDGRNRFMDDFSARVQHRIEQAMFAAMAPHMGWPVLPSVTETLAAAEPYVNPALEGEAVLTVGGAREAWRRRQIDGVLSVGPLECMPTKIAEAQFHRLSEREGLLSLTLSFNGDPLNSAALDNFAFEVHERFRQRKLKLEAEG